MATKNRRQITIHFDGCDTDMLKWFETNAKSQYRTTEAQILFELRGIYGIALDCGAKGTSTASEEDGQEKYRPENGVQEDPFSSLPENA